MKIHIVLSPSLRTDDIPEKARNEFRARTTNEIKKFYGEDLEILLHNDNRSKTRESDDYLARVFVMGETKANYPGYDRDIFNAFQTCISGLYQQMGKTFSSVTVKSNYSAIDPSFNPSVSGERSATFSARSRPASSQLQSDKSSGENTGEFDYMERSKTFQAEEPQYSFEQVILPNNIREKIEEAIGVIEVERKVFDDWGLRTIFPNPSSALSFFGPSGTGKTMAAEAVAHRMKRKILRASYADIESKYHGEGPKMVKAIFMAAERDNAVLFIDESDSLLSKRLTNVSDGSGQAINSMRSQLLISLERFNGIVIFATNLVVNYDRAFLTRLISVEFTKPDKESREKIWHNHMKADGLKIPLAGDVDIPELAEKFDFCGREIRNAVKNACVSAALQKKDVVCQEDFIIAGDKLILESEQLANAGDHTKAGTPIGGETGEIIKKALQKKLDENTTGSSPVETNTGADT